jgi:hypothetical protein
VVSSCGFVIVKTTHVKTPHEILVCSQSFENRKQHQQSDFLTLVFLFQSAGNVKGLMRSSVDVDGAKLMSGRQRVNGGVLGWCAEVLRG